MTPFDDKQTYSPSGNTEKEARAKEIQAWTIEEAKQRSQHEGVVFTVDHLAVLTFLRKFYVDYGWPKSTHELTQVLDEHFKIEGGNKYLHKLFPDGPVAQATRLAGLPVPSYAVDKSFGSTY